VFSSWRKSLDAFAAVLPQYGISFVQLDGSLSLPERQQVLDAFRHDEKKTVLLMTLATGAVG